MAGAALAVTVFSMVLGSSGVPELVGPGRKIRWLALLALALVGLGLAARERRHVDRVPFGVLAGGAWLVAVAAVSTAWSVDPRLTFGRAGSLAILFVTAGGLSLAARARPELPGRLLIGLLAGTVAASLGGLLLLVVDHAEAVQAATTTTPPRLRGIGENPDTLAMLDGVVLPAALWAFERARAMPGRLLALASILLLGGSISASGSRGGLLAAFVGGVGYTLTRRASVRRRLAFSLAVCVATFGAAAGTKIPQPLPQSAASQTPASGSAGPQAPLQVGQTVGLPEPRYNGRLTDELFRTYAGPRSFFQSSGRLQAWSTAFHQGDSRPLLGFGFGTEDKVFIDRIFNFQGSYVENSFIGLYLQLGVVGVLSLLALLAAVCIGAARAVRRAAAGAASPALAGVVAAGIALMGVQSYAYSVGNVATVAFWTCGFVGAAVAGAALERRPAPARGREEGVVAQA